LASVNLQGDPCPKLSPSSLHTQGRQLPHTLS
jgi:hypothetical protein